MFLNQKLTFIAPTGPETRIQEQIVSFRGGPRHQIPDTGSQEL